MNYTKLFPVNFENYEHFDLRAQSIKPPIERLQKVNGFKTDVIVHSGNFVSLDRLNFKFTIA